MRVAIATALCLLALAAGLQNQKGEVKAENKSDSALNLISTNAEYHHYSRRHSRGEREFRGDEYHSYGSRDWEPEIRGQGDYDELDEEESSYRPHHHGRYRGDNAQFRMDASRTDEEVEALLDSSRKTREIEALRMKVKKDKRLIRKERRALDLAIQKAERTRAELKKARESERVALQQVVKLEHALVDEKTKESKLRHIAVKEKAARKRLEEELLRDEKKIAKLSKELKLAMNRDFDVVSKPKAHQATAVPDELDDDAEDDTETIDPIKIQTIPSSDRDDTSKEPETRKEPRTQEEPKALKKPAPRIESNVVSEEDTIQVSQITAENSKKSNSTVSLVAPVPFIPEAPISDPQTMSQTVLIIVIIGVVSCVVGTACSCGYMAFAKKQLIRKVHG
ncbi:hypothetical protein AAMO2058_000512000 [Amorphochlora amoebiformis]